MNKKLLVLVGISAGILYLVSLIDLEAHRLWITSVLVFIGLVSLLSFIKGFVIGVLKIELKDKDRVKSVEEIWDKVDSIGVWFLLIGILYLLGTPLVNLRFFFLIPCGTALLMLVRLLIKKE